MIISITITLLVINIYLPYVVTKTNIISKLLLDKCVDYGNICDQNESIHCCNNYGLCRATGLLNNALDDIHKCLSPAINGEFCRSDLDCLGLDNTICNSGVNQCQCVPNFGILRNIRGCVALIGGYCDGQADCTVSDTICVEQKCQCKEKFIKKSLRECRESTIEKKCERDIDCEDVLHFGCSVGKKCVCKDNHVLIDNSTCVPLLDEFCWSDEQCAPAHSVCFENRCRCRPNHIAVSNVYCIKMRLGRVCSSHDDCSDISHAVCSIFRRCVCQENNVIANANECRRPPNSSKVYS